MARGKGKIQVSTFAGGLHSDASSLNTPPNTTVDEDNCELDRKSFRKRRLGLTYEDGYAFASLTALEDDVDSYWIKSHKWKAPDNNTDLRFLVVQFGPTLHFYDTSFDPLSDGEKDFTIDLTSFAAPTASDDDVAAYGVDMDHGKGALFVVGEKIEPFYVTYNQGTDTITTTGITLRIRDLEKQDTTTIIDARPSTASNELLYDLYNQGWGYAQVSANDSNSPGAVVAQNQVALDFYLAKTGVYPPRSKPWWIGNRAAVDPGEAGFQKIFDPTGAYDPTYAGNTLAPFGHFILEYFNKKRSTLSGLTGLSNEVEDSRPTAVAFGAGRVFYGHKSNVLFSPVITDDLSIVGDCYQAADPTAEDINDLIATDGGVIFIGTSGIPQKLVAKDNSIIALYNNGCYAIGGTTPGDGFSATGHSVRRISGIGTLSSRTVVKAESNISWWNEDGIYIMGNSEGSPDAFGITNIVDNKLQTYYNEIPTLAKEQATGAYDSIRKRFVWLYQDNDDLNSETNRFYYNKVLNFDTVKQAFFPFTISELPTEQPPKLVEVFNRSTFTVASASESLVDSSGVVITDSTGAAVTINAQTYADAVGLTSDVRYIVVGPTSGSSFFTTGYTCGTLATNDEPATADKVADWINPLRVTCGVVNIASISMSYPGTGSVAGYFKLPYIRVYNFGFALPTAANIVGVEVSYQYGPSAGVNNMFEDEVRLAWGAGASTLSVDNMAEGTDYVGVHTVIRGSPSDTWGQALTPAIVNSSDFGWVLKIRRNDPLEVASLSWGSSSLGLDDMKIKLYYTV